jgi:membrane-associated protease RseP (regulator of RpoE activity)
MSKFETVKSEVISGGSMSTEPPPEADTVTKFVGLGAWLALFVALAYFNLWWFVFVVGILLSVFLHEVGHYWTARRSGMKVTQFFIGFGPRVWSFHRNGIEYGLRAVPLGAFVKIIGMTSIDEIPVEDEPRTYRAGSYPRRMWVITAGSVMHMILAIVIITAVYATWGSVDESGQVTVATVTAPADGQPASPAFAAGVRDGDVVRSVAGVDVATTEEFQAAIRRQPVGSTFDVVIDRGGVLRTLPVTSAQHPDFDKPTSYLGIGSYSVFEDRQQKSVPEAVGRGAKDLVIGVGQATKAIVKVINPVSVWGHLVGTNDDASSRPTTLVGATRISDDAGKLDGWAGVLSLLAALNVSVGIFNMFPLLPLDGGHAAIATYERVRSRRGQRYYADVQKLMPVVAATVVALAFMFLTGLYLDIAQPAR